MIIGGFQKSSLIDYPEKISAIVFTQGCNFKCPYCHNPELIKAKCKMQNAKSGVGSFTKTQGIEAEHILEFLDSRKGKLDGVVITGGEPTLHKDLPEFIKEIKGLRFYVKLDTNGTNPKMLQKLLDEKLIDYVAMDIKAPIEKYEEIVCAKANTKNILKSIEILKSSNIDYEFRTTVVKSQLSINDFEKIGDMISGAGKYYIQRFLPTKTLDESFMQEITCSDREFEKIIEELKKYVKHVRLR